MIGTTAALIGMGIASTAGGVANAAIQSRAASNAAKIQNQAMQRSAALNQMMWGQQRKAYQPFINLGTGAAGLLGKLMMPAGFNINAPVMDDDASAAPRPNRSFWGVQ